MADALKVHRSALLALATLLLLPSAASAQIIVKRDAGLTRAERADLRAEAGVRFVRTLPLPRTEVVAPRDGRTGAALRDLNADPDVVYAERDRPVRALAADADFDRMWGLQNLGTFSIGGVPAVADADMDVVEAWPATTGAGVTVAVVDSGVDAAHPDLAGRVMPGYDWVQDDEDASDVNGHGTHVAGTIAAVRDNGIGGAGVAPEAQILPLRVLGDDGWGTTSDVIAAFDAAGERGVRVVNASLGGGSFSRTEYDVLASHPETLYVVAAGNDGADNDVGATAEYPCSYDLPNVLCVGASTHADARADFSNYGRTTVDVFAPGYYVWSTLPAARYSFMSGTSMATPHVAGAAALLLGRDGELAAADVRAALLDSAEPKPAFAGYSVTGARANAAAAVALVDCANGDADACPPPADAPEEPAPPTSTAPTAPAPTPTPTPTPPPAAPTAPAPTAPKPAPTPVPRPPADRDRDGRPDATDACPTEPAATATGCPVPALASGSARVRRRVVRIALGTDRAATLRVTVQRRKRTRWVRVARRTLSAADRTARLKLARLKRGGHRARIAVSSPAGSGRTRTLRFRVR